MKKTGAGPVRTMLTASETDDSQHRTPPPGPQTGLRGGIMQLLETTSGLSSRPTHRSASVGLFPLLRARLSPLSEPGCPQPGFPPFGGKLPPTSPLKNTDLPCGTGFQPAKTSVAPASRRTNTASIPCHTSSTARYGSLRGLVDSAPDGRIRAVRSISPHLRRRANPSTSGWAWSRCRIRWQVRNVR